MQATAKLSREDRKKTGAFRSFEYNKMQDAVALLCNRAVAYHKTNLTCDDIKRLFIKPEHYGIVSEVVAAIELNPGMGFSTQVKLSSLRKANVVINLKHEDKGFVFPGYMGQKVYDAPEVKSAIVNWTERRIEIGQAFALASEVLTELHARCDSPEVVRFYWPGIIGLATVAGLDLADKVRDMKVPKSMPAIPPPLRVAMAETTATIAKAMMMPANHPTWELKQQVRLSICTPYPTVFAPWTDNMDNSIVLKPF